MEEALAQARKAEILGEIPVGSVVVLDDKIIGRGFNQCIELSDPSAHAEVQALRQAASTISNHRLEHSTLYVTLEPCIMCAGAVLHGRVKRVVFGAYDSRFGAAGSQLNLLESIFLNHRASITAGVCREACEELLGKFFADKRR